jgi:CubicO group peptidase (beta-lactamase class C family)
VAVGNQELGAQLSALAGRGTRSLAVALIDVGVSPNTRFAFIDAEAETRFEIGSITKALTGMLLAVAIERGEISMESKISTILNNCSDSEFGSITVKELCTHTSGLPRLPRSHLTFVRGMQFLVLGSDPYRGITSSEVLRLASRQWLRHRGQWRYSNLGAAVLGQLLTKVADTDYASLLRERIFLPIGMNSSSVANPDETAPHGWSSAGLRRAPWIMNGYAPAGGVISTVNDMSLLVTALLDGSAPGRDSLIPIAGVESDGPNRATAMFWIIDSLPGTERTMAWHGGETGGHSAFLALFLQASRSVVVLANVARGNDQRRIALSLMRWFVTQGASPPDI